MEPHSLQSVIDYLTQKRYLLILKGKYSLSKSFHEDVDKLRRGIEVIPSISNNGIVLAEGRDSVFFKFIQDAKVPQRLNDGRGGWYDANKYSEKASIVLIRILEERHDYEILVKSTMLYYASGISYKKKISSYLIDGDWKSYYNDLALSAEKGEEVLKEHIKNELNDGSHSQWSI